MIEPQFLYGIFINRRTKTFSSGVSRYLMGHFAAIIQRIPKPAVPCFSCQRKDGDGCPFCPRQVPGHWGAYGGVSMDPHWPWGGFNHHGGMPYAVAETLAKIEIAAGDPFRFQLGPYSRCNNLKSLEASMRYRGYENFDDSLVVAREILDPESRSDETNEA